MRPRYQYCGVDTQGSLMPMIVAMVTLAVASIAYAYCVRGKAATRAWLITLARVGRFFRR